MMHTYRLANEHTLAVVREESSPVNTHQLHNRTNSVAANDSSRPTKISNLRVHRAQTNRTVTNTLPPCHLEACQPMAEQSELPQWHQPATNMNGSDKNSIRRNIVDKITKAIVLRNAGHDDKLCQQQQQHHGTDLRQQSIISKDEKNARKMAKNLEFHLYNTATTWEEYQDESTLQSRLQLVAKHCLKRSVWQHEPSDRSLRCQMIGRIQILIRQKLPLQLANNKQYVEGTLMGMAKRVEEVLYREAKTRKEYADTSTIAFRLHGLALRQRSSMGQCDDNGV